eukprot:gene10980-12143_t
MRATFRNQQYLIYCGGNFFCPGQTKVHKQQILRSSFKTALSGHFCKQKACSDHNGNSTSRDYLQRKTEKKQEAWRSQRTSKRTNIIIFLADDLGIGDVGCFGNHTINTPNIDQLAKDGMILEHNLAPESICTPSRAAMLTGRYAIRSGLASEEGYIRVFTQTAVQGGLPPDEVTFASVLQQHGYKTAFIGKWHLGLSCNTSTDFCHHPNNHGFDYFYGLPVSNQRECKQDLGASFTNIDKNIRIIIASIFVLFPTIYSLVKRRMTAVSVLAILLCTSLLYVYMPLILKGMTRHMFACILMRDKQVVEQPVALESLTQRLTIDAVNFISESADKGPFLIYVSFTKVHTELSTCAAFKNKSKHGRYGDSVEEMDWAIGRILDEVDKLELRDSTFVYFTSDHGPDLEEVTRDGEVCGGSPGHFKGHKSTSYEGGIRVPTVVRWPGKTRQGSRLSQPTSGLDIFPTVLKIANVSGPDGVQLDGEDISDLFTASRENGAVLVERNRFIFHYCARSLQAVTYSDVTRSKIWKLHFMTPDLTPGKQTCVIIGSLCPCYGKHVTHHSPPLVFELISDPGEQYPIDTSNEVMNFMIKDVMVAVDKHKASLIEKPNQLKLTTFIPWMQLCCNSPFCNCKEDFPHKLIPIVL